METENNEVPDFDLPAPAESKVKTEGLPVSVRPKVHVGGSTCISCEG